METMRRLRANTGTRAAAQRATLILQHLPGGAFKIPVYGRRGSEQCTVGLLRAPPRKHPQGTVVFPQNTGACKDSGTRRIELVSTRGARGRFKLNECVGSLRGKGREAGSD